MPVWIIIMLRSLGAISFLFLMTRILGKKQISQLTFFEYITGIALGDLAGFISTDVEKHYMYGLVALLVWTLVPLSMEFLTLKSKKLRNLVEGEGTVVIKDGKVLEDNLRKVRYNSDELLEQLRIKNAFKVADVEFAVLEANGDLSVLLKRENQPITPAHLGIKVSPEQEPQAVIMDGSIMDEPLATIGRNRNWLFGELKKIGVTVDNVFIGQVDSYGKLYVDLYDDQLKTPDSHNKEVLMATLKKCAADLELFSLEATNESAKSMYEENSNLMNKLIAQLTPLLKR